MHLLKETKYKANTENTGTGTVSSWGRIVDQDPHKATEKKLLQELKLKNGLKEAQKVNSAVETATNAVLSEIAENKNVLKIYAEETNQKETAKGRGEKQETKDKPPTKENSEGKGEGREVTKERAIAKESVECNAMIGIGEKLNLWNSEQKMNRKNGMEKSKVEGKTNTDRVKKNVVLEEATRRVTDIENAERSISTTSREKTMTPCELSEKVRRKNKEDCVSMESKSKEIEDKNTNPERVITQADSCLRKQSSEEIVFQEKESREERQESDKSVEESPLMGIAEKVNLWNSKEKKNKRSAIDKDKGKIEGQSSVETNELLQEASRRISNVETAERSIVTSREVVGKVVGSKEVMDRRERSGDIMWREYAEKAKRKKEEDTASVETKSKEIMEVKNMNPQATNKIRNYERNSSQHREVKSVLRNSEAKSTKEIVRNNSQEFTQKEDSASHGFREMDRGQSSSQRSEETSILRNTEAKSTIEIVRNASQEVTQKEESASHGSRESDKEKSSSQYYEKISILRASEAKTSGEIERSKSQEVRQEEISASEVSRENAKERYSSKQDDKVSILRNPNDQKGVMEVEDEETKMVEREETEDVKQEILGFVNDDWDENKMEDDEFEDYDPFYGENMDDWIQDISRPRSYWEELRKERYLEVLNTKSDKTDICNLIKRRTVSNFLASDLRQKIYNLMITRVQGHLGVQEKEEDGDEGEWGFECSARIEDNNKTEKETMEKINLETVSDVCSQSSARSSTIISWTFKDQEGTSLSLPEPSVPTNQSKTQETSDLRRQMEQFQREVLELRSSVKTCIDMQLHFQTSLTQNLSHSGSYAQQQVDTAKDPLKRKCCVCSEMPIDSLLYRCGHMCTCLNVLINCNGAVRNVQYVWLQSSTS